jgi:hypothetical protein
VRAAVVVGQAVDIAAMQQHVAGAILVLERAHVLFLEGLAVEPSGRWKVLGPVTVIAVP